MGSDDGPDVPGGPPAAPIETAAGPAISQEERGPHGSGGAPTAAAPAAPATPARATQYEVLSYADSQGRAFSEFRSRDGSPDRFKGLATVERRWSDGVGARQAFPFEIDARSVDEAFARYDEAKAAAVKAGGEELDRQHARAVLTGATPAAGAALPIGPRHPPARGPRGGERRRT